MPERLALPMRPPAPEPPPFPLVGVLAPLVVAGVLFAVLRSPAVLLFAAFTPVLAIAGVLDGHRQIRRRARRDESRHREALAALSRSAGVLRTEREAAERRAAPGPEVFDGAVRPGEPVVIGTSDRRIEPQVAGTPADERERTITADSALLRRVPFVIPADLTIGATGQGLVVAAFGRAVRVARHAVRAPAGPLLRGPAAASADLEVRIDDPTDAVVVRGPAGLRGRRFRPALVTGAAARALLPEESPSPSLAALLAAPATGGGLPARFALAGGTPVDVDLVADGPHAIVAGTTGSGKSALLVAWVLALAAAHPPDRLTVLLVDHKGGAAFDPVAGLPHVAGVVTDLEPDGTERAVASLKAELAHRERVLRDAGAADVTGTDLPRLVVLVDEFRALLEARPALAAVFVDVAARGRSLGVHLVLCTQRPAGAIRDELLTNCGLRIALRVLDPADSAAVVGTPAAAALPRFPVGAAILAVPGEPPRPITVARVDADAVASGLAAARTGSPARRPWLDPLPARLPLSALPAAAEGVLVLGLTDAPEAQEQPPLAWRPAGGLLVAGRPGSGRTTTLLLAGGLLGAADPAGDPAAAWDAVHDDTIPVVLDDLETLLDRLGPAVAAALLDRLAGRLRAGTSAPVVLAVRGPAAWSGLSVRQVAGLCDARLLLDLDLDDHLALGGPRVGHRPNARPGAGWWQGRRAQVALPPWPRPPAVPAAVTAFVPGADPVPLVSTRATVRADQLRAAGLDAGAPGSAARQVLVGTPAEWQAHWAVLARSAAGGPVLVDRVPPADLRTLLGAVPPAPPLPGDDDVVRYRSDAEPDRVRLPNPG